MVTPVNDAGKELSDHPGRVEAFLDFLGVGPEDPRRGAASLYSSHVFGEAPKQVRCRTRNKQQGDEERQAGLDRKIITPVAVVLQ